MIFECANNKKGFVLLFAVSLAGILLAIALGVSSIASKEIRFGTSARDTSAAFFAADSGAECAVFHDKSSATVFPVDGQETSISCGARNIPIDYFTTLNGGMYDFVMTGLGDRGNGCAKVTVEKDAATDPLYTKTIITSKGYNTGDAECEGSQPSRVEREIRVTYFVGNPAPPAGLGFPRVVGSAQSSQGVSRTHVVMLPATVAEGDLLIALFSMNGNASSSWPAGWTQLFRETEGDYIYATTFEARYKIATAAEAGANKTITVTTGSDVTTVHQALSIIDFSGVPEAGTVKGSVPNPDPPNLSPSWGQAKSLWLAAVGRGYGNTTNPPAGYGNYVSQSAGSNYDTTRVETARLEKDAANENPGYFSVANSGDGWVAATIAVEGEP